MTVAGFGFGLLFVLLLSRVGSLVQQYLAVEISDLEKQPTLNPSSKCTSIRASIFFPFPGSPRA